MIKSSKLHILSKDNNVSFKLTYKVSVTPGEERKDIKGYEGTYKISNFGRIKHIGKPSKNKKDTFSKFDFIVSDKLSRGYRQVQLVDDFGNKTTCYVHKLVAEAFISNPNNYKHVNHKDENKENNLATNLEWCDVLYNNTYNDRHVKVGEKERHYINLIKFENNEKVNLGIMKLTDITKYHISVNAVYKYIDTDKIFYFRVNKACYKIYSV